MRSSRIRKGLFLLALLMPTPASAADDVRSAIETANDRWEADAARGDGAAVAAL